MGDLMTFPKTWEEFERTYGFTDKDEVYTNGARLIPSFRVEQWLEHIEAPTIDAEPVRHGRWIYKECGGIGCFICSECGQAIWNAEGNHYCFNCGAKMDEEN